MERSGILYCAFQLAAFAGVPVTMPASRQNWDFCSAGAIWRVLKLPRPHKAKPILRFGSAANAPSSGKPATASVEVFKKSRRDTNGDFMAAAYAGRSGRDKLK